MTLISRLEQAEAGSRELDAEIAKAIGWGCVRQCPQANNHWFCWKKDYRSGVWIALPHYTTSLDAAMSLVPEGWVIVDVCQRLPCLHQWEWAVRLGVLEDGTWRYVRGCSAKAPGSFALAICIASLKAAGYE